MSVSDQQLLDQLMLAQKDEQLWGELLNAHRTRLRVTVDLRMQEQLRARVDASDVIQEAFMDATRRLPAAVPAFAGQP